jgi:anti-sigma factor ChrR (cupin superfamily)
MDPERMQELAALHAVGALDGADLREWQQFLVDGGGQAKAASAAFADVAALVAVAAAEPRSPRPELRARLLDAVQASSQPAPEQPFTFIRQSDEGWKALPVPGAYIKLLSVDHTRRSAVLLGKLEPGTHYPAHYHKDAEDIYVLSGDLHIAGETLYAGDFHRAAAGTSHPINHSEHGCTILAVLSTDHVLAKFALA